LEVYSQLYSKEHVPTTGGKGSIVRVSYAAKISEEPEPAVYVDTVNWDVNTPDAFADVYAARVASDLKLTNLNAVRIGMELRNALNKAKKAVSAGTYTLKPLASPNNVLRKERSKLPAVVRGDKAREYLEMWQKRNSQSGSAAVVDTAHDNPSEDAIKKNPLLSSSLPPEQNAVT
jgi:hypothetical protein